MTGAQVKKNSTTVSDQLDLGLLPADLGPGPVHSPCWTLKTSMNECTCLRKSVVAAFVQEGGGKLHNWAS